MVRIATSARFYATVVRFRAGPAGSLGPGSRVRRGIMVRKAIAAAALLLAVAALEPAAAQRARTGVLELRCFGRFRIHHRLATIGDLHCSRRTAGDRGGLYRDDFAVRSRRRRDRAGPKWCGPCSPNTWGRGPACWPATMSAPPARRPSRSGSAPTSWSVDRTGTVALQPLSVRDKSDSISRSASPICACVQAGAPIRFWITPRFHPRNFKSKAAES